MPINTVLYIYTDTHIYSHTIYIYKIHIYVYCIYVYIYTQIQLLFDTTNVNFNNIKLTGVNNSLMSLVPL